MSSEVEGGGLIAAAVALPVAAAFGAGWLAWQAGKQAGNLVWQAGKQAGNLAWQAGNLLAEANDAVDREIEMKQRRCREAERQRRLTAQASRRHLAAMCSSILTELEAAEGNLAEVESLRQELRQICGRSLSEDSAGMEHQNAEDLAHLDWIIGRQDRLRELKVFDSDACDERKVADLMRDLRMAAAAAKIRETRGEDVKAVDPAALERAELNRRLSEVSARVMTALEFVVDMAEHYGLSRANSVWFQSCFNGVDQRIQAMCSPTMSNANLKKAVRSLEETMDQYDMLYPTLKQEKEKLAALYLVYVDGARALGEPVRPLKQFKGAAALEEALQTLQTRAQRASECAQIYQKLGPAAYLCYAWDEELRAMGYTVYTRRQITELVRYRPERAKLGEAALPFYQWSQEGLTQLYQITPECDLQLIVHPDGSTTMQTIAAQGAEHPERVVSAQKGHCSRLRAIHQRLRENWFVLYDYQETAPAEDLLSAERWLSARDNPWAQPAGWERDAAGVRENVRGGEQKVMREQ